MRILTQLPITVQALSVKRRKRGKVLQVIRIGRITITVRQSKSGETFLVIDEPP